jgi:tripartite-type tricarboxylate transporter receptor subunit TctC
MKNILFMLTSFVFLQVPVFAQNTDAVTEIIIPFAPGGAATQVGQFVGKVLNDNGTNAIVINKPGNNSIIAGNYVAKSEPNGRTLFIGSTSSIVSNTVFKNQQVGLEYTESSFAPIVLLNQSALGMVVAANAPFKNYEDFKKYIKANPTKFNIGTFNANYGHLFKDWAQRERLPEPTIVFYKGSAGMIADVVGGSLLVAFDNVGWGAPALPLLDANRLRLIATFDNTASKDVARVGYPVTDLSKLHSELKFSVWIALFAPAGTPTSVINNLNKTINQAVTDTQYRSQVIFMDGIGGSPDVLGNMVKRDLQTLKRFNK